MKCLDTHPILPILLSKQQTPPHIQVKFKETPNSKLVEFYKHSPHNKKKKKNIYTPHLDVFDIFLEILKYRYNL